MTSHLALLLRVFWPLLALVLAAAVVAAACFARAHRRGRRRLRRLFVGVDAAASARVGMEMPLVGPDRLEHVAEVVKVDKRGFVTVAVRPPPSAQERGAERREAALLRALGFDPATHDLHFVTTPFRGVQVSRAGERVRFFTEKQVRGLSGAWKTALRTVAG